ncbi:MAG: hypothetical protein IH845_01855 [Nanoarchaeota archaeon]|nr:hypothetical protein [Nanoarchaeota archaeon]
MGLKKILKNGLDKAVLATSLISVLGGNGAIADESVVNLRNRDYRVETNYSGDVSGSSPYTIENVFATASKGTYNGDRSRTGGEFVEDLRFRDITEVIDGSVDNHYTLGGLRVPRQKIGGVDTRMLLYGAIDGINGIGVETLHKMSSAPGLLGNLQVTLDYSERFNPTKARHLGGGLNLQVNDNVLVGFGFDSVSDESGRTNQYHLTGELDLTDRDTLGGAFVLTNNPDGSTDKGIRALYIRHKGDWGLRLLGSGNWNDRHDSSNYWGQVIFAQNPTTDKPGGTWFVGRNVTDEEENHYAVIPLGLRITTPTPADRARSGFSFILDGGLSKDPFSESVNFGGILAYMHSRKFGKDEFGGSIGTSHSFGETSDVRDSKTTLDLDGVYRKGNLTFYVGAGIPIGGKMADKSPRLSSGIEYKF